MLATAAKGIEWKLLHDKIPATMGEIARNRRV